MIIYEATEIQTDFSSGALAIEILKADEKEKLILNKDKTYRIIKHTCNHGEINKPCTFENVSL